MLAFLAALALTPPIQPSWDFLGTTNGGARLFVDRSSISTYGSIVRVTIRLGAPRPLARNIVKVIQQEEIDCSADRWRLLGYQAFDDADRLVDQKLPGATSFQFLMIDGDSIAGSVRDAVCPNRDINLPAPLPPHLKR